MSLTEIRQPLDLTACASEPIHIPGGIQPHGALLVVDESRLAVLQASRNAARVLTGGDGTSLLGRPLDAVVGEAQAAAIRARATAGHSSPARQATRVNTWRSPTGELLDCIVHARDGLLIIEWEQIDPAQAQIEELSGQVLQFIAALEASTQVEQLCRLVAQQVRELIGFDRVLVYQFDEHWNGIVIGEDGNGRLPSYLDLRFPASDIPAQARELYRINRSRLIPTADYAPVPIEPTLNPLTGRPLDLTFSTLRSVSPVHLEYMKNMGTAASTSFSVLRNGKLWGLIACHNEKPAQVRFTVRRACEMVAQTFALQLAAQEGREAAEMRVRLGETRSRLLVSMASEAAYEAALAEQGDALLACTAADGAAIVSDGTVRLVGVTPTESQVVDLVRWLGGQPAQEVFATDELAASFPEAGAYREIGSGVLAISISRFHRSFLIWFRPEVARTVSWAGDPHKAATAGPYESKLHPRASFEAWKETVRGVARPWHPAELESAAALRNDIVSIVLRKAEEVAALSGELERSNKELEAFSYSVSHDLRAPFRHIVGYSELLNELEASRLSDRGKRYVQTVIDAARTAGRLIDNLLSFSQMGRSGLNQMSVDLTRLVEEVRAEVVAADAASRKIEWTVHELPTVWGDPNMLRLVFRNLISNAVKYSRNRDVAHIAVRATTDEREHVFEVRDDGVGFDMAYVDKLFGVFQRLHRMEEFEGTGIGLANVRRIVSRHGGRTWAEGKVGEGAAFFFSLPVRSAT